VEAGRAPTLEIYDVSGLADVSDLAWPEQSGVVRNGDMAGAVAASYFAADANGVRSEARVGRLK